MEVTRKNFIKTLPLVEASIEKADFLVIDAEFTGLINGRDVTMFDSPAEYYNKLLNGSSDFLLIQYGLCAFYWDEIQNEYLNDSYNFYLFPRGRPGPEKTFLCQSASLDFLAAQGFDFNKLIREGISYMTEPAEAVLRQNLEQKHKAQSNNIDIIIIPEENKPQIESICDRVRTFLDEKKSDDMEIDKCNAFVRRLLFQELNTRFKNEAYFETKILENKDRVLRVVRTGSPSEVKNRETQKKAKEWEDFEEAVGFSKVARMISQSGKLVIGHNMLLDVLHTLNHFFQPLPSDYKTFKEFTHCMFPKLLDTKYMSSLPPFKDWVNSSVLQHLLATLSEHPFALPKAGSVEGRGYSKADEKAHEAGYDAYITGLCFLAMYAHLARMRGDTDHRVVTDSAILKPFVNKLFLAKTAHQALPYMNLVGVDPTPSRDHVFHLTFPKEWQRNEINQLFSPFGPVTVQFLDDTSALIALSRRDHTSDVTKILKKNGKVRLISYESYKNKINKKFVSDYATKKWTMVETQDISVNTPDSTRKSRKANPSSKMGTPSPKQPLPVKVDRAQFNSVTSSAQSDGDQPSTVTSPAKRETTVTETDSPSKSEDSQCDGVSTLVVPQTSRKRTSSGVFQVDNEEPPPKKSDVVRSKSDAARKKPEVMPNGRRKSETDKDDQITDKKVIEKFDIEATSKCVTAFKESDSWD